MFKEINSFEDFLNFPKFYNINDIINFNNNFDIYKIINKINLFFYNYDEKNFFNFINIVNEYYHRINQVILSLAPFSYKDDAYKLQNKLLKLNSYLEVISRCKSDYQIFLEKLIKNPELTEFEIEEIINQHIILKEEENKKEKNNNKENDNYISKVDKENKIDKENNNKDISNNEENKISDVYDDKNDIISKKDVELIEEIDKINKQNLKEQFLKRIKLRNELIQTLLDIYHEKKNGYKLMVGLFRGLDMYRRMSLSGEIFNKNVFMANFRKYLTYFPDANLIELCLNKNPNLTYNTVKSMIVDCLKIINKQIDRSRFKINFENKLDYRSGFTNEFQQKVFWLYFPEKRRPKRNIDELYTIKSVSENTSKYKQTKYKSYVSLLSKRDIDIINHILPKLHSLYYKNPDIRKYCIQLFHSLDNFEYNSYQMSPEQQNIFKEKFNKAVLSEADPKKSIYRFIVELNPKIKPLDIKNVLPLAIRIMKEKIDIGFERMKKTNPVLSHSFNPLEKYYQIYDKKYFIIYRRI